MPNPALIVMGLIVPQVFGQTSDGLDGNVGDLGGFLGREVSDAFFELVESEDMFVDERAVDVFRFDEKVSYGESQRTVGPRAWLNEKMGTFRGLCASRIDDDELGSVFERLVDEDGLMDVGLGGVLSPHDDELRIGEVPGRGMLVVAESQSSRLEAGRPAQVAVGRRVAAEETPEAVRDAVQNALGAASFIEKDALWAVLGSVVGRAFRQSYRGPRPRRRCQSRPFRGVVARGGEGGQENRPAPRSSVL